MQGESGTQGIGRSGDVPVLGDAEVSGSFGVEGRQQGWRMIFQPGSRTDWHRHSGMRTLLAVTGQGLVQRQGDQADPLEPGDVISLEPGHSHWFGASDEGPFELIVLDHWETAGDSPLS